MKKLTALLLTSTILLSGISSIASDIPEIKVFVNGEQLNFDVAPIAESGRTLVPMRTIFEKLNCEVDYKVENGKTTVFASCGEDSISFVIGEKFMNVNGVAKELDVPAKIIDNRTLVPLRAVSESLEAEVQWDADTSSVIIKKQDNIFENVVQVLNSLEVGTAGSTEKAKITLEEIISLVDLNNPSLVSIQDDFSKYFLSLSGEQLNAFNEKIELLYNAYLEKIAELTQNYEFDEETLAKYDYIAQGVSKASYKGVKYVKPEYLKYDENATYYVGHCTKMDPDEHVLGLNLYSDNIYDAVEVSQLKKGDLLYCDNGIIEVDTIEDTKNGYTINGGLDNFGAWLCPNEGGTYIEHLMDTDIAKTRIGTVELPLSDDCVYTNKFELNKEPIITNGKKEVIEQIIVDDTFTPGVNQIVIEDGKIVEVISEYHP